MILLFILFKTVCVVALLVLTIRDLDMGNVSEQSWITGILFALILLGIVV